MERVKLILQYIKDGYSQKELPSVLWDKHYITVSLATIEKDLKAVRAEYGAKHMFQLAFMLIEDKYFEKEDIIVQE